MERRLLGTVPLGRLDRRTPPLDTLLSSGLNARLFTDLSTLGPTTLITRNDRFFLRTACPRAVPAAPTWSIRVGGLVVRPHAISLASIRSLIQPQGVHLVECSGNADPTNFGLMSAARWDGVPLGTLLERMRPLSRASPVLVGGIDDPERTPTSIPGASWVFTRDQLHETRAFLATGMNGAPLPRDHGFPVRLIVPGWYGCVCAKWVDQIDFVDDDAPATAQMREFAARTHQNGTPALARDYAPAEIDHAATVVRVEKWLVRGSLEYQVAGIQWGGSRPLNTLTIRFGRDAPFVPVEYCPLPASTTTWSWWSHRWRPQAPGVYEIVLRFNDPTQRTRRLDRFFYARQVQIDQV